jgi:hypothetical protein
MNQLPLCVQYIQALGLPIFAAVLAGVGAWIGWQQMQLNRVKLQHDLFDRRFRVYDGARRFLEAALRDSEVSDDTITDYLVAIGGAVLLFDDDNALARGVR